MYEDLNRLRGGKAYKNEEFKGPGNENAEDF
jgi:hypothetical protein